MKPSAKRNGKQGEDVRGGGDVGGKPRRGRTQEVD